MKTSIQKLGRITGLSVGRNNYQRLREAERYLTTDSETVRRIENILGNLITRLNVEGASLVLSCKRDVCIAQAGQMNMEYDGDLSKTRSIFFGKPILSKRKYMKPIKSENFVVGYLAVQIKEDQNADIESFCNIYADQLLHELEMAQIKSDLDEKSKRLRRKKQELKEVQKYNDNLLSITSHDLSSPLNAISGYLDLIDNCLKDEVHLNQIIQYHKRIQSGVHDVMDMLNQMSDIGKFERESMLPDMIKVNLSWVVENVCNLLECNAQSKEIDLRVKLAEQPVYIEADTVLLKRIIRNLVDNAIKYTERGGRVVVNVIRKDGEAYLKIEDNGTGISKKDIQRIFTPFVKLYESKEYTSNGIGLFVTSYFVNLLNGEIKVESKKNRGSTFSVCFPTLNPFSLAAS